MSEFAITISCLLNNTDNRITTFVLDTVQDNTVDLSSTITTHPVVSGDMIADHIINNPSSMSISGSFSYNGSQGLIVDGEGSRFENLQDMFEKIKREGILCEIVKVQMINKNESTQQPRFKRRSNMILNSITWVEKINSLDFSFNFTQVLLADVQQYDVDLDDSYLPNVTEPNTLNFTDTLIDWGQVDASLIETLVSFDLITDEFLNMMQSMTATSLVALGVAVAVAAVIVSIPGVGWVAAAVGAAIAAAVVVVVGLINWIKGIVRRNKYRIEQFKKYKKDSDNKKEVQRFCNFVGEIHTQLSKLNDYMKVYSISSNEAQECMLTIDNNYYIFTYTKNNTNSTYSLHITDVNDSTRAVVSDVSSALEDISQCTNQNYLFRADEGGSYVYIMCPDEDKSDLTHYFMLVSGIDMNEYNNIIKDIIKNALTY